MVAVPIDAHQEPRDLHKSVRSLTVAALFCMAALRLAMPPV